MSITLTVGGTTLNLPVDLMWADENNWFPVEQTVERSVTGAVIVSTYSRIAGRNITLQPEDDSASWMPRATLEQIKTWAAVPGQVLTLNLRGIARSVIFRHHDGDAVSANPVVHYTDVDSADWYLTTLKFLEL